MSTKVASVYGEIGVKDNYTPELGKFRTQLVGLGKDLLGPAAGFATLTGAVKGFIDLEKAAFAAAAESEVAIARLGTTLDSTGRSSEISASQISSVASELQNLSTFDDENIIDAYNAISKFGNIETGNLDSVVKAAMDVSAATGGDLAGNAEQIARVLETGLIPRTWGFTNALKEQVKQQVEAGDTGEALTTVLDELNKRYGGQAAAQMDTYAGKVEHLKNQWGDFLENIGGAQMPEAKGIIDAIGHSLHGANMFMQAAGKLANYGGGAKWYDFLFPPAGGVDLFIRNINAYQRMVKEAEYPDPSKWKGYRSWTAPTDDLTGSMKDQGLSVSEATVYWKTYYEALASGTDATGAAEAATKALSNAITHEYSAVSSLAQDYTQSVQDLATAQEAANQAASEFGLDSDQYKTAQKAVEDLQAAQKRQTDMWVLDVLTQQFSIDGLSSGEMAYLLQYQVNTGIITQEAADRAQAMYDYAMKLASIPRDVYTTVHLQFETSSYDFANNPSSWVPSTSTTTTPSKYSSAHQAWLDYWNGKGPKPSGIDPGYASGADFIVPPGYPNDSYPMRVQSGEHVQVTPAGQTPRGGNVTNNFYGYQEPYAIADALDQMAAVRSLMNG